MKKRLFLLCIGAIFLFAMNAQAAVIFSDDFEVDLSQWVGKSAAAHHGQLVDDPAGILTNDVLNFSEMNSAGDIFTTGSAFSAGTYWISFDYYGDSTASSRDSGGYVGVSQGFPDSHTWLWATGSVSGADPVLVDDDSWHSYLFTFTYGADFHLMLEDFSNGGVAGDAYFDNIVLYDANPIPEPATMLLLGAGLIGLAGVRRKLKI